jgi:DNA-binding winged helix-turn-helix (wHTH) protein
LLETPHRTNPLHQREDIVPRPLRIFISATWEDLQPEREAISKALQKPPEIIVESMANWGSKSTPPKAASLETLELCNLYIGVIGFKYGKITEEEYDYASKKNITRLIYVKDANSRVPSKFVEQDPKKMRKLQLFKQRLQEEVTFTHFKDAGELSARALRDVLDFASQAKPPERRTTNILSLQRGWLASHNLSINPFQFTSAQTEQALGDYFVEFNDLQLEDLRYDPRSYAIFGNNGAGKSALAKMIAEGCYPYRENSDILVIQFDIAAWEEIRRQTQLRGPSHLYYIQQILRKAIEELKKKVGNHPSSEVQDKIEKFEGIIRENTPALTESTSYKKILEELTRLVRLAGLHAVVCLINQVGEISGIEEDHAKILMLLAPLMSSSFQDTEGMHYRFFLPAKFEELMNSQKSTFHLDAFCVKYIEWDTELLKKLISERLKYASDSKYVRLWQICEDLKLIDDYLTAKVNSNHNPRAVLWLANRLIEVHCQPSAVLSKEEIRKWEPPLLINLRTWVKVKNEWDTRARRLIIDPIEFDREGFNIIDGHCYFGKKRLLLKPEHESALITLIYAQGEICTNEMLKIAMWQEKAETRDLHNLQVEFSRLKKELKKQGAPDDWIQNIRSEGYQLSKYILPAKKSSRRKK